VSTIRALVVDDEPLAREGVRVLLERDEETECVGECGDGEEAVEEIRRLQPDLVFLDVQMPEMDGFAVLEELEPEELPVVVFVTAYDAYAIRAFEVHALDYLLKPYDDERFFDALDRAKAELRHRRDTAFTERLEALLEERGEEAPSAGGAGGDGGEGSGRDRIMIKSSGRIQFVAVSEIDWVEAAGDYVRLHTGERSHLLRETMKGLQARLDPDRFVRVHRSTIVRLSFVREVRSSDSGQYDVVLKDGTRRSLSRSGRKRLEEALGTRL
jgi:two-component system LytT family response regulator